MLDKQGTGGTEFQLYDGFGNVYQSLTPSGGYVLTGEICDDFGQHFGGTTGTDDLMYKWRASSGYRWDGDGLWTGSYNEPIVEVGARYYIPAMGVFITRDKHLGQRPYEYCNADPVNYDDPSGYDPGSAKWDGGNSINNTMNLSQFNTTTTEPNETIPAITMQPSSGATASQGTTNATNSVTTPPISFEGGMLTVTDQLPNQLGGALTSGGLTAGGSYNFGGTGSSFRGSYGTGLQFGISAGNTSPIYSISYHSPIEF